MKPTTVAFVFLIFAVVCSSGITQAQSLPDLIVLSGPEGPKDAEIGKEYNISLDIKNQGTGSTTGAFNIKIYMGNQEVEDVVYSNILGPGISRNVRATVKIPSGVPSSGNWTATVDPSGFERESNENNNSRTGNSFKVVQQLPDLIVSSGPEGPTEVEIGKEYNIDLDIKNQGAGPTTGAFNIKIYMEGQEVKDVVYSDILGPGISRNVRATVKIPSNVPSSGNWTATVDPSGFERESNENNNSLTGNSFRAKQLPDLIVSSGPEGPADVEIGKEYNIDLDIKNQGGGPTTGAFNIKIYMENQEVEDVVYSDILGPGISRNVRATVKIPSNIPLSGNWTATVDPSGFEKESKEDNNSRIGTGYSGRKPVFRISPLSLAFGGVRVEQRSQESLTVSNDGNADLHVSAISSNDETFKASPASFIVPSGKSQLVQVSFSPSILGTRSGTLTITHNADGSPATVPVSGTGSGGPVLKLSAHSLEFGEVAANGSKVVQLTVSNTGNADMLVTGVTVSDPAFEVSVSSFTVPHGGNRDIGVTFSPGMVGLKRASLMITHNAPGSPSEVTLTGAGLEPDKPPEISAQPQPLDFGSIRIDETPTRPLTVENKGDGTLSVFNIASSSTSFRLQNQSDITFDLSSGESKKVQVIFFPAKMGKAIATLTIQSNDPNHPNYQVAVQANVAGNDCPDFRVVTGSVDFGQVDFGSQEEFPLVVKNEGIAPGQIYGVRPDNNQIEVLSSVPVTVQPDRTVTVSLAYIPSPYRLRQGKISLYTDDCVKPIIKLGWQAQEVPVTAVTVSRTAPSDGDLDVELETRVDIRFSEPLMRLGRHFVAADVGIQPRPQNRNWQENWDLSVDGKTLIFPNVTFENNRIYHLTVLSAVAESGNELVDPLDAVFTTGRANPADVGMISGQVKLTNRIRQPDGTAWVDTAQTVEGRVFAVNQTDEVVAESPLGQDGSYQLNRLSPDGYRVYVEVEGQDRPISVGVDRDNDGRPDVMTVSPRGMFTDMDAVVSDVEVSEDAPGDVFLDADPSPRNQKSAEGTVGADSLVAVAVYVEGVEAMTRFEALVEFDDAALEFVGFQIPEEGEGEDAPILTGRRDGARMTQERPVVKRLGGDVTVEGNQVKIQGQLLDGRKENAPSGGGLLGILQFAAMAGRELAGGKPAAAKAASYAKVTIQDLTLMGVDRKKTIQNAGTVRIILEECDSCRGPISLDLNTQSGDQKQRQTTSVPAVENQVTVDIVAVSGALNQVAFQVKLKYDPKKLEWVSFQTQDIFASGFAIPPKPSDGQITINVAIMGGVATNAADPRTRLFIGI